MKRGPVQREGEKALYLKWLSSEKIGLYAYKMIDLTGIHLRIVLPRGISAVDIRSNIPERDRNLQFHHNRDSGEVHILWMDVEGLVFSPGEEILSTLLKWEDGFDHERGGTLQVEGIAIDNSGREYRIELLQPYSIQKVEERAQNQEEGSEIVSGRAWQMRLYSPEEGEVQIAVYNQLGRMMYVREAMLLRGENHIRIPVNGWSAGNYFVHITGRGDVRRYRFVIVR